MRLELQKMNYKIYLVPEIIYDPMPPWSVSCVHFCRNRTCRMAMIGFKGENASFSPDPGGLRGPGLLRKTHGVAHGLIALGASWDRPGAWATFL